MWADLAVALGLLVMFVVGVWLGHGAAKADNPAPIWAHDEDEHIDQMHAADDPPWGRY